MTPEQFDKLVAILGNIGNSAYQAALRSVYAEMWSDIITAGLCLVFSIGLGIAVYKLLHIRPHDDDARFFIYLAAAIAGILVLTAVLASASSLLSAMRLSIAPEWYAIEKMAGLVVK